MISAIIPVYQNKATLKELHLRLKKALPHEHEIVFVDDASPDQSLLLLREIAAQDPSVRILSLPKNQGQHRAAIEGVKASSGDTLVILDADLQDPPEKIPHLLREIEAGNEAVFGGRSGKYESPLRLATSKIFKLCLRSLCGIPSNSGMFVALTRKMADAALQIPIGFPFLVAMIGLTGLPYSSIPIQRPKRSQGRSAYNHWARLRLALKVLYHTRKAKKQLVHNRNQQHYYSKNNHFNILPENHPHSIERHIDEMLKCIPQQGRILEVGCGAGRFTLPLAKRGLQIEGADLSEVLTQAARMHSRGTIPFHTFNLLSPPPTLLGQFDAIIGFFILHHLYDQRQAFRSIFSLLKPGGTAAFIEPNPYNPLFYLQIALHPRMRWKNERHILSMRPAHLKRSLGGASLRFHRFGFFPPFLSASPPFRRLEKRLEKIPLLHPILPFQIFHLSKSKTAFPLDNA